MREIIGQTPIVEATTEGRRAIEQRARVFRQDADIALPTGVDVLQQVRDTVQERLAADHADFGIGRRVGGQMLAAAEADLDPQVAHRLFEQGAWVQARTFVRRLDRQPGQQGFQQVGLINAKSTAASAAVDFFRQIGRRILARTRRTIRQRRTADP